jgi:SulP family sulfate permease
MFSAARTLLSQHAGGTGLRQNVLAGLTVGIIALPLSMALAIASGVPPQHGLYTAIIAGIVIALTGGSRVNISGPTAAFVVILVPITHKFGLGGLLVSGLMAGIILVIMGVARLGTLIQVVPYPVTIGFTAGIGTVIAFLQIKDFFGLDTGPLDEHFLDNVATLFRALPSLRFSELAIGALTLATLILWRRTRSRIPAHLIALLAGSVLAWLGAQVIDDFQVATIGSRFQFTIDGITGHGIPSVMPHFVWPWELPDKDGRPIGFSPALLTSLFGSALAIAMLGALESLLCATVADGMTGDKHDPNDELIGQGLGNIVVPFFGGIPATAAIARTAANVRAGGNSPLSSVVHALFIVAAILALAPLLAWIPMASMAALLLVVAWGMSEARHFARIVRIAPRDDVMTLLTCFVLTVVFNMEIAVAVGIGLAAMLFIRRSIALTGARLVERHEHLHGEKLPASVLLYDIDGPLFFGAAQKALSEIATLRREVRVVILDMSDVTLLDMTAIVALESIIDNLGKKHVALIINNLQPRMRVKLRRAGIRQQRSHVEFTRSLHDAARLASLRAAPTPVA